MIFLALDQSSKISGYSVFKDNELIDYGYINCTSAAIEQRLLKLISLLDELLQKHNFDKLIFEDIQEQNGNVKTFKVLAQVQGAILLWCAYNKIKYEIIPPTVWRKKIKDIYNIDFGRVRNEQKQASITFVKNHFGLVTNEDESDAICIGVSVYKPSAW